MSSFKLDRDPDLNKQMEQGGIFAVILGLIVGGLFNPVAGLGLTLLGIVVFLAGRFAS